MKLTRLKELAGINETTGNCPEVVSRSILNALPVVKGDDKKDKKDKENAKLNRLKVLAGLITKE